VNIQSFSKPRLFANEKHTAVLVVFVVCIVLRTVPELRAYPYPIGYDVVNFYIPTVADFGDKWDTVSKQFPLYVIFLYFISTTTGLPAHSVVAGMAIVMAGIFGMSLFYLGRNLLKLGISHSAFLAIFAIFQVPVLRTMWDLHKDIFALTTMMFAFSLLGRKDAGWKALAQTMALATLTVAADRMIGALFCLSLAVYAVMTRRRDIILTAILGIGLFCALMVASYGIPDIDTGIITMTTHTSSMSQNEASEFYRPTNLVILFAVMNGLIAAPAAIGFFTMKNSLLKIPLLVSLVGSFSWLVFPENSLLVADRWIVLSGVFLSVFAGYGIIRVLVKKLKPSLCSVVAGSLLAAFAIVGLAYAVMPHDSPFILYGAARPYIQNFGPVTMQFNSLDIEDNKNLLSTIVWLNKNTEPDAMIVGEKHWRGFMELYLADGRTYVPSNDPFTLAAALEKQGKPTYLISVEAGLHTNFTIEDMRRS
jgi:hypothetical protein